MSEPVVSSAGDESYRPLSGFALAGLCLGSLFAALVVFGAAVAVIKGSPIFIPLGLLIVPVAAFVFGLVGRSHIVGPNATREGLRLANLAVILSAFSGLGYAAYYVSIGLAVSQQAEEFMVGDPEPNRGFFKHLMRGEKNPADLDIAFLLTRPATARIKYRPGDDENLRATYDQPSLDAQAGDVTRFKNRKFIRMIVQGGEKSTFESLGVRDWEYDKSSYKVVRSYRILTPQAAFDMVFLIESTEPEAEGQIRQWHVNLAGEPKIKYELTSFGSAILQLFEQGRDHVEKDWQPKSREGKAVEDLKTFDKSNWEQLIAKASDGGKNKKLASPEYYRDQLRSMFEGKSTDSFSFIVDDSMWPIWGRDGAGRVWFDHPIRMTLHGNGEQPTLAAEGRLRLRSKGAVDPESATSPVPLQQWTVEEVAIERLRALRGQ